MGISAKTIIRTDLITADGKARIEFVIYFRGKQYRISLGKSIEPKYWCSDSECVDRKSPDSLAINKQLSERIATFDKFVKTKEVLNEKVLLNELKTILRGQSLEKKVAPQKKKCPTLSEAFDSYVEHNELKFGTKLNYTMTKNIVNDFCKKKYSIGLNVKEVDFDFLEKFKRYLRVERAQPNNKNTIAKRLKNLKTVLFYAQNQGHLDKNPFQGYKIEHGKPREVALSADEYNILRKTRLPQTACDSMKFTRDIFIFCCETGLRYSDVMDLRWEHIDKNISSISKAQVKTERDVFIPVSNQAKALIIAYKNKENKPKGYVFPRINNQIMNRYLKDIAQVAGINKNLTTHVARHTFGTRLGATGFVSSFALSELMGHSDVGMTQRYINLSKNDLTKAMQQAWTQIKTFNSLN